MRDPSRLMPCVNACLMSPSLDRPRPVSLSEVRFAETTSPQTTSRIFTPPAKFRPGRARPSLSAGVWQWPQAIVATSERPRWTGEAASASACLA